MKKTEIIVIKKNKLRKYWTCSYGAFLDNWGNYGWTIVTDDKEKEWASKWLSHEFWIQLSKTDIVRW